jgi:hypothetical protein
MSRRSKIELQAFPPLFKRRRVVGSLIGGIPETQEMLDYCAAKNITADIELISIKDINSAYVRIEKSDVKSFCDRSGDFVSVAALRRSQMPLLKGCKGLRPKITYQ